MASTTQSVQRSFAAGFMPACRRLLACAAVSLGVVLVVHAVAVQGFHVPTGSMAPALLGHHRRCICPRCGHEVAVGRSPSDSEGRGEPRFYKNAFCSNCDYSPLPVTDATETPGDQITVDRTAYLRRAPSRWEILVFRLFGNLYIKRLLGLPGEVIRLHDGDAYVDGSLCRKTLEEARRMRVLVFDQKKAPPGGWKDRWDNVSPEPPPSEKDRGSLALSAGDTLTYRNFSLDTRKCAPIRDEYAYSGGAHAGSECVRDFSIETQIEPMAGRGTLSLRLCDGQDWVEVRLPIGKAGTVEAFTWPMEAPKDRRKLGDTPKTAALRANHRYRLELAFVDRRVSLAVDGRLWLSADLPEPGERAGVTRPFQAKAEGVQVRLHHFRLYRDVHYSQHGRHGVQGKSVRLGADQYFMLGDNSANSEDSRCWPNEGRVRLGNLIGPVLR